MVLLIAIVALGLVFDYTNGFHDTANAIATSVSTRALSPRVAIVMAAGLNLLGALIYTGVANDKKDFDPFNVVYDGSLLWFSNADAKYLWSWTAATGLTRHAVQLPGVPFTGKRPAGYTIAGPCV